MIINAAFQLLPLNDSKKAIEVINSVIKEIESSKLPYIVCPFETVVEGTAEQLMQLSSRLLETAHQNGADEVILQVKLHSVKGENVYFKDKIESWNLFQKQNL